MESSYKTQQNLMAKKAEENGIPTSEITKQFQQILSQIYQQNSHCNEAWALEKAEYLVWTKFFPNDPWPGTPPKTTPLPSTTRSESGEVTSSPDEKDPSSLPSKPKPTFSLKVEEVLLNAAGNATILVAYKEALVNMKERYPRESLEWQQWMSGSKVWLSNFRQKGTFPCNEPPRSYVLRSSDANRLHAGHSRHGGEDWPRNGRSGSSWRPEDATSRRRSRSPPSGPSGRVAYRQTRYQESSEKTRQGRTIKIEETPRDDRTIRAREPSRDGRTMRNGDGEPLTYGPKEDQMQRKAYAMGGDVFRHTFFRAMQNSRDIVRTSHPEYDRSQKHWLADRMAWEKVFKDEPFPWLNDKPPGIPKNSLPNNKLATKYASNFSMATPPAQGIVDQSDIKTIAPAGNCPLVPPRPSHSRNSFDQKQTAGGATPVGSSPEMPRKLLVAQPKGVVKAVGDQFSEKNRANPVEGTREVTIRKNTLLRALLGDWDDSFKSVQRGLGVTMEYNDDASDHLRLIIEPYQPGDYAALEKAYQFLEIWKRLIYSDHLVKLDHFWAQYKNHDRTNSVNHEPLIYVNGKKILCSGKFGDLCDFFSYEIQIYQSNMARYINTENALACSTLFEAKPFSIHLTSYPLPVMLKVDTKTRNKILDEHDAFLEEWVRSSLQKRIALSDMSNDYARRRNQQRMDLNMDLDELLKEGAAKANQKP
ncbi:c47034a3-12d2-460b-9fff-5ec132b76ee7 [Sclerotinia trifoliorum]|uniref:C47034a3-12d2-460b-9fff-5ec132b76ee7 n=1 Tax=Sclerotinia trifoliorum TaxID=28548 RepID=A0A8H2VWD5_9HELO|nr:c47034a3-12d2-460b-9fff-5ec132b76ee7 [Sclerotinia trifoliorum]